jgi:uncharacterized repeat protein (TIGR03803 family)
MALTRGPSDVIYGMASFGGQHGSGTIFKITTSGDFTVLYTFSALDASGNNPDGAYPLRALVAGNDGNLYGTTRLGGPNICLFTHGCGVAWMIDGKGPGGREVAGHTAQPYRYPSIACNSDAA